MARLARRSKQPELMDGADVTQEDFAACISDLAKVNTLTLARRPTLDFVARALRGAPHDRVVTILDVGFGAGDMLRAIHRQCARARQYPRLIGIDLNPRSEPVARAATPESMRIEYRTGDVYDWPKTEPVDLVISSLVTHHMTDDEIVRFLHWMEDHARLGWFVNDLHRHALAYEGFRALSAVMRWHRFVGHDGLVSIARSFRRDDWARLLRAAGVANCAEVTWRFPFRYCVERRNW